MSASLSVLLINEQAEESKLVSTSLRGFFPDCRIEAVYSSDDALQWSARNDWHLILIDEHMSPRGGVEILQELKRTCPYAAIILQTDRHDSANALHALQQGADFLLFKGSPSFITDLLFYAQEAIEKRELQVKLDHTFQRHLRLVEAVSDVVYELDHEGRFVYLSPTVTSLLGYTPEELAGQHFSILLPPTQETPAKNRMNERRAGARSTFRLELHLLRKTSSQDDHPQVLMQVTAKGLYDARHRYTGTVGLLHDLSHELKQSDKLLELETRLQEAGRQLAVSEQANSASRKLEQPLSALVQDSHQLLASIQNIRIEQHLERLSSHAVRASELGQQLFQALHISPAQGDHISLNLQIQDAVASLIQERVIAKEFVSGEFSQNLPLIIGISRNIREMFRILIRYARQSLAGRRHSLTVRTHAINLPASPDPPDSSVGWPSMIHYVVATIREGVPRSLHQESEPDRPGAESIAPIDLLQAHDIIQQHGGIIEIASSVRAPFQITVRFPAMTAARPAEADTQNESTAQAAEFPPSETRAPDPAPVESADRRRYPRTTLSHSTDLSLGKQTLHGAVINIGLGGLFFVSHEFVSTVEDHPVYLVLRTPVSFLELHGIAHQRSAATSEEYPTGLAITFTSLNETDAAVLASLIQELQKQSPHVQIEGMIPQDALNDTDSLASAPLYAERRWHSRANLAIPVYVEQFESGPEAERHIGLLVNIGSGGACLQIRLQPHDIPPRFFIRHMEASAGSRQRSRQIEEVLDRPISCRVSWKSALIQRPDEPPSNRLAKTWQIGLRFEHLADESEEGLNRLLFSKLLAPPETDYRLPGAAVTTTTHRRFNAQGHTLILSQDYARKGAGTHTPILIISPGYGQLKIDYLALAYVFALNGFRVIRHDLANGLGLSDGSLHATTLSGIRQDLEAVLEFVRERWPTAQVNLLTSDLSARAVLKLAASDYGIDHLLLLNPILDLSDALTRVHGRDLLSEYKEGVRRGVINLLGRNTDLDLFLADAYGGEYTDLESVAQDMKRLRCTVTFLFSSYTDVVASDASRTTRDDVDTTREILGDRAVTVNLPSPLVVDGPPPVEEYYRTLEALVLHCAQATGLASLESHQFHQPDAAELRRQYRIELDQLRTRRHVSQESRRSLWIQHARTAPRISEVPSYLQHFDHMYQFALPTAERSTLLDVGCGHNGFARLLLLNQFYRLRSQRYAKEQRIEYLGIDAGADIIAAARGALQSVQRHVDVVFSGCLSGQGLLSPRWLLADTDDALPFAENSFDRVVGHFTLNFSQNPLNTLRELYRVLRPRGQLILSCLTAFTNLAPSYRQHLRDLHQDEFHPECQEILLALGMLHESLRCRRLPVFNSRSLTDLFAHVTSTPLLTFPTLHGHLLIATVEKPDSSG